jgi:hypothetical protein
MEIIRITFSELRCISVSVISFIEQEYWFEKDSSFKTELENDLGITGDDGAELMKKFSKRFGVNLSDFQVDQYFYPEPTAGSPLVIIFAFILLVIFLLKVIVVLLLFPFNQKKSQEIWYHNLIGYLNKFADQFVNDKEEKEKKKLMIADLISSVIKGKFIHRQEIKFVLVKSKDLV